MGKKRKAATLAEEQEVTRKLGEAIATAPPVPLASQALSLSSLRDTVDVTLAFPVLPPRTESDVFRSMLNRPDTPSNRAARDAELRSIRERNFRYTEEDLLRAAAAPLPTRLATMPFYTLELTPIPVRVEQGWGTTVESMTTSEVVSLERALRGWMMAPMKGLRRVEILIRTGGAMAPMVVVCAFIDIYDRVTGIATELASKEAIDHDKILKSTDPRAMAGHMIPEAITKVFAHEVFECFRDPQGRIVQDPHG